MLEPFFADARQNPSPNGASLRLHDPDGMAADAQEDDARSWSGDSIVLCALLEQMGRERADWKPAAALKAVDALIVQLLDRSETPEATVENQQWDRLVLLATLLGYRDLLSALCGDGNALSRRLAKASPHE